MAESYELSTVLEAFDSLKEKKWVDKIKEKVKQTIFWGDLNEANIEEFKKFNRLFGSLYDLMKEKFSEIYRTTWERYFEHLRAVVNNVLDLPNPTVEKVLIAIAHDSIEDTDKTFEWLNEDYKYKVALWVQAISKSPWEDYLTDEEKEEKLSLEFAIGSPWTKSLNSKAVKLLKEIKDLWKDRRNDDYFWHLESIKKLSRHIVKIALDKWILEYEYKWEEISKITLDWNEMSKKEFKIILQQITQDVLDVKLADRIHNLSTQWNPKDTKTVRRKVDETKEYFLEIAMKHNPEAYEKLQSLILKLEIKLHNTNSNVNELVS